MTTVRGDLRTIRFDTFELDRGTGELRRQGVRVRLQEQPLRILQMLLENPGRLVTRDELRHALWPTNSYIDFDQGLNRAINKLREALGDSADHPRFIETLSRRGYRFLGAESVDSTQIRSLLILPLDDLASDPEQSYFADGLTESLITTFAKISALRVLSRTTAAFYKQVPKTLPEIARELGVDGVVEGSVMRTQGRVRITVQLLHAPTDTHLWAESYERDIRDILALQAEVTTAIAREIKVKITPHEQSQLARAPPVDPEAFDAYLRGRCYWEKRTPGSTRTGIECFQLAIDRDPAFGQAYAGLAECFGTQGFWGYAAPAEGCAKAKVLATRTLEMDPNMAEAHTALAWAVEFYDYDFPTAEREYRRAIELDPRASIAHFRLGMLLGFLGRFDEADIEAKRGIALDPLSPIAKGGLCMIIWFARQHQRLLGHTKELVELHPDVPYSHWSLAMAYLETHNLPAAVAAMRCATELAGDATLYRALLAETYAAAGRREDAVEILNRLQAESGGRYVTPYMIARIHAALGDTDEAVRWLETAYEERAAWMVLLKHDPRLDGIRSDPRVGALIRQMNYPS